MFGLWTNTERNNGTQCHNSALNCDCNDPEMPLEDEYSVAGTDVSSENSGSRSAQDSRSAQNRSRGQANGSYGQVSASSEANHRLKASYANATPLFKGIEKKDWQGVLSFLNKGKWSNSFFVSTTDHMSNPSPKHQCQTWVIEYAKNDPAKVEWCQLPLHAAISYGAPAVVIQKIIDTYPEAVQMRDNEDMLPAHLAFGFSSPDQVLIALLKSYPEGARQRGPGGRLPHECCELGPNKVRGEVFGFVASQTAALSKHENDDLYMICVRENYQKLGLPDVSRTDNKDLTEIIAELLEERKELMEMKLKQQGLGYSQLNLPTPELPSQALAVNATRSKSPLKNFRTQSSPVSSPKYSKSSMIMSSVLPTSHGITPGADVEHTLILPPTSTRKQDKGKKVEAVKTDQISSEPAKAPLEVIDADKDSSEKELPLIVLPNLNALPSAESSRPSNVAQSIALSPATLQHQVEIPSPTTNSISKDTKAKQTSVSTKTRRWRKNFINM